MNEIKKILIREDELKERVKDLGLRITADYQSSEGLILIGILRGSVIFFSDLARNINLKNVVFDFMTVTSYSSEKSSGEVKILKDLVENIEGKDILIVEDILDSGFTMSLLKEHLQKRNPKSMKVCCLLDKAETRRVKIKADYAGFGIDNDFVVGYGLDYNQNYRNLPYVAVLNPSVYLKKHL